MNYTTVVNNLDGMEYARVCLQGKRQSDAMSFKLKSKWRGPTFEGPTFE
jgi:hypothetical protein